MQNGNSYPISCFKKTTLFIIISLFYVSHFVNAQDANPIKVKLSENIFQKGDTINFEINSSDSLDLRSPSTLHLWIEEIKTGRKWHYRYPFINGFLSADLKVDSIIEAGNYAFNFSLQKSFFSLRGEVLETEKKINFLTYAILSKTNQTLINLVQLNSENAFKISNTLFQDSAFIVFSKPKHNNNDLKIKIETPLDSAFNPKDIVTAFVTIGIKTDSIKIPSVKINDYAFTLKNDVYKTILPEVVVNSKSNREIEKFEQENVSGLFAGDAIVLDGLGSDEMSRAGDIYNYLLSKVGGLKIQTDNENGERFLTWRSKPTDIYIDEVRLDKTMEINVNPADIAMIKIFRPGESVSTGSGEKGAIAIYMKTGQYKKPSSMTNSFYILGYTGLDSFWK